jgi:hypothetical protein
MKNIYQRIKEAWSLETCYPSLRDKWDEDSPETGQCVVTALLIQDLFGGFIIYNERYNHYWNKLPDNTELDLTRGQFGDITILKIDGSRDREVFLSNEDTKKRYNLLVENFNKINF